MKNINRILIVILFISHAFTTNVISQDTKDIQLLTPVKIGGKPLMNALNDRSSSREFSATELSLQQLSDLLWAADGINRPESNKRTAPSAMNIQEMKVYVILHSGIYEYMPKENVLKLHKAGNFMKLAGKQEYVENAALNLVFVSDTSLMKNSTENDKILFAGVHTGCITQNVYLYCVSAGLNTVTRRFIDIPELKKIMGLSEKEMIVLSQTVGFKP